MVTPTVAHKPYFRIASREEYFPSQVNDEGSTSAMSRSSEFAASSIIDISSGLAESEMNRKSFMYAVTAISAANSKCVKSREVTRLNFWAMALWQRYRLRWRRARVPQRPNLAERGQGEPSEFLMIAHRSAHQRVTNEPARYRRALVLTKVLCQNAFSDAHLAHSDFHASKCVQ